MLADVALDGIEVSQNGVDICVVFAQIVDEMPDREPGNFPVQCLQLLSRFLVPDLELTKKLLQALLELGNYLLDALLLSLRKMLKLGCVEDLFGFADGSKGESRGCLDQGDTTLDALLAQLLQGQGSEHWSFAWVRHRNR